MDWMVVQERGDAAATATGSKRGQEQ